MCLQAVHQPATRVPLISSDQLVLKPPYIKVKVIELLIASGEKINFILEWLSQKAFFAQPYAYAPTVYCYEMQTVHERGGVKADTI